MSEYNFKKIEEDWQKKWREENAYQISNNSSKPKYYVLDMFPYPSGAGLHVGHPLGYIASDIVSRYKKLKGYHVLHPMGYDAFGLPAEQYAIQTGQHPSVTTEENIKRYREQLDKIGFCYDWDREIRTCDPQYYRWTQWIFLEFFNSWYNPKTDKAEPIETLIQLFENKGFQQEEDYILTGNIETELKHFSADDWKSMSEEDQQSILMQFRLAYLSESYVNWCAALGTVLANDEVKDGVSERGGYPVERKLMMQWSMRITAYSERLLNDLNTIDWPEPLKEAQRNWIGKSSGCSIRFKVENTNHFIEVFTTRPDTLFGVSFVTLAPEHELVSQIVTESYKQEVEEYITYAQNRTDRERMADVKKITGKFTGAYVIHPFTGKSIPIWIGDYVLAGYGTGAVMAVPAHDSRDYAFAKHFNLPILEVVQGGDLSVESYDAKEGILVHSDFLNGLEVSEAIGRMIQEIELQNIGKGTINYRLRDAIFGRQRYWGEPIPIYYKNGIPHPISYDKLPLILPEIDKYLPTETGEPPLGRAENWDWDETNQCVVAKGKGYPIEQTTMPGWAGSSWYMFRYMDNNNDQEFASQAALNYWQQVDLYMGGSEHATGHLLYVRFWTKFLYDRGFIPVNEPAKKLINQGMIQGRSNLMYRLLWNISSFGDDLNKNIPNVYISKSIIDNIKLNNSNSVEYKSKLIESINKITNKHFKNVIYTESSWNDRLGIIPITEIHVNINCVDPKDDTLDISKFRNEKLNNIENINSYFICEDFNIISPEITLFNSKFICLYETEKMSKSKYNVVVPDNIILNYGADTLRLYEMFLGPIEQSKPWNTSGIEGVHRFLKKLWALCYDRNGNFIITDEPATLPELKVLHKVIKKASDDIDNFSFNTSVSAFMIAVNELNDLNCHKKSIIEKLLILINPYAPHITEELYQKLGNTESILNSHWPEFNPEYLVENSFNYPISVNGKLRFTMELSLDLSATEIEQIVISDEQTQKWLAGQTPKKIIYVKNKIVNIVI